MLGRSVLNSMRNGATCFINSRHLRRKICCTDRHSHGLARTVPGLHDGAIQLLDEADVFFARRSLNDVARSNLASVFLRRLEYCEGILFLTTNRVTEFDEAILRDFHLLFRYCDLDSSGKVKD